VGSLVVNTDLKTFVPTTTDASSPADNSIQSAGWSTAEIVFLSFLVFFLVFSVSLISLYIRLDHRHKSRSRQPADMYEDEARDAYIGRNTNDKVFQRNGDPEQNGTGGDLNIVPVSLLDQHPPPRRYISTSNPFELLYGASFMHSEKPKVEKKKASPKKKQTANIKPMLSITEEEQEHGDSMHSTTEWDGGYFVLAAKHAVVVEGARTCQGAGQLSLCLSRLSSSRRYSLFDVHTQGRGTG
jgi:hypothetical protein